MREKALRKNLIRMAHQNPAVRQKVLAVLTLPLPPLTRSPALPKAGAWSDLDFDLSVSGGSAGAAAGGSLTDWQQAFHAWRAKEGAKFAKFMRQALGEHASRAAGFIQQVSGAVGWDNAFWDMSLRGKDELLEYAKQLRHALLPHAEEIGVTLEFQHQIAGHLEAFANLLAKVNQQFDAVYAARERMAEKRQKELNDQHGTLWQTRPLTHSEVEEVLRQVGGPPSHIPGKVSPEREWEAAVARALSGHSGPATPESWVGKVRAAANEIIGRSAPRQAAIRYKAMPQAAARAMTHEIRQVQKMIPQLFSKYWDHTQGHWLGDEDDEEPAPIVSEVSAALRKAGTLLDTAATDLLIHTHPPGGAPGNDHTARRHAKQATTRYRQLSSEAALALLEDIEKIRERITQVISRYWEHGQSHWLGGNLDTNNSEEPSAVVKSVFEALRQANAVLSKAASDLVLHAVRAP